MTAASARARRIERRRPRAFVTFVPRRTLAGSHLARTRTRRLLMPEKVTLQRARRDERQGKAPSTQAGEFISEEIHHVREGKHGARSTKQIGRASCRERV